MRASLYGRYVRVLMFWTFSQPFCTFLIPEAPSLNSVSPCENIVVIIMIPITPYIICELIIFLCYRLPPTSTLLPVDDISGLAISVFRLPLISSSKPSRCRVGSRPLETPLVDPPVDISGLTISASKSPLNPPVDISGFAILAFKSFLNSSSTPCRRHFGIRHSGF